MLTKRISSGLFCTLLLVLVMFLSTIWPFVLNLAVAVVSFFCINEILDLKKENKKKILSIISIAFSITRPLIGAGKKWQALIYFYAVFCFIIAMFRFAKNKKKKSSYKSVWNVWFVFFLNIVISVALSTIVEIRNFGKDFGVFLSFLSLGIAWSCDVGAYFSGKYLGKNKLSPYVSPNKTIEGAIGGVVFSFLFSCIFCVFCCFVLKKSNLLIFNVLVMSIFGAPIAILGDLCFSLLKRMLSIKDFGDMIPGHGGVLDRFDSVIFVSPFVLIFLRFFNIMS